jgi:trimethylamine--corrinoid protein Co-methyltransferase
MTIGRALVGEVGFAITGAELLSGVGLAGAMVVGNAENLATLTLAQLVRPHTPVVYSAWACAMDPKTSRFSYGAPEFALGANALNASLARYYDLPCYGFGGCTDSKTPDAQAGAEVMMNCMVAGMSGVSLIHDCGYLAGGSVGSMEMAVIDNEIIGYVLRILRGVDVDDETLAVDVIKTVGPGGHFMSQRHTLAHLHEFYMPNLFDRVPEAAWVKAGRRETQQVAQQKAKQILKDHVVRELDAGIRQKISEIVRNAEREITKGKPLGGWQQNSAAN